MTAIVLHFTAAQAKGREIEITYDCKHREGICLSLQIRSAVSMKTFLIQSDGVSYQNG